MFDQSCWLLAVGSRSVTSCGLGVGFLRVESGFCGLRSDFCGLRSDFCGLKPVTSLAAPRLWVDVKAPGLGPALRRWERISKGEVHSKKGSAHDRVATGERTHLWANLTR